MAFGSFLPFTRKLVLVTAGAALMLAGCQSFREATGSVKTPPNEFAVVTKAPLIMPPDYNLRPPQPGAPDRNTPDATEAARRALFQRDANAAADSLGPGYSAGEKMLLSRSGGAVAPGDARDNLNQETGVTDQGAGFAQKVISGGQAPAPAAPATRGSSE